MPYKALTYIRLADPDDPDSPGIVKEPGETITKAEFQIAKQTADDINTLEKSGAISSDKDAEIDPAHWPVETHYEVTTDRHVAATDGGSGNA